MLEFHFKESSGPTLPAPQASKISLAVGYSTGVLDMLAASYIFESSLAHTICVFCSGADGDSRKSSQRAFTSAFDSFFFF